MPDALIPAADRAVAPTDNQPKASALALADLRAYLLDDDATLPGLLKRVNEALPIVLQEEAAPHAATAEELTGYLKRWTDRTAERAKSVPPLPAIMDEDEAGKATNLVKRAKTAKKDVEGWHGIMKRPYIEGGKAVDGAKNTLVNLLDSIDRTVTGYINGYQARLEAERRAEAERIRREAEEKERTAREAAEAGDKAAADQAAAEARSLQHQADETTAGPAQVRSGHGALATTRRTWTFEIVDATAVPRAFCAPSQDLIKAAIKSGVRSIDGVRIFEDVSTIVR